MKTSVVTSSVTRKTTLLRMLDCLAKQTRLPDEIILIEAGEGRWTAEEVPEILRARFQVHYAPKESLAASRDRGRKLATGDVVIFLDDDLILPPTYIEAAVNFLEAHPTIMAVGGRYTDSTVTGRASWSLKVGQWLGIYADGSHNRVLPSGWADYVRGESANAITKADWLFGCNSAVRASAFTRSGVGFETQMAAWSFLEDVMFSTRLKRVWGDCLRVLPELTVVHAPLASSGQLSRVTLRMRILYRYLFWRNELKATSRAAFWLGMLANLLLMIKIERKFWVVRECLISYLYCLRQPHMDWEKANEFVFSKD